LERFGEQTDLMPVDTVFCRHGAPICHAGADLVLNGLRRFRVEIEMLRSLNQRGNGVLVVVSEIDARRSVFTKVRIRIDIERR
jgi:hypothetical protein